MSLGSVGPRYGRRVKGFIFYKLNSHISAVRFTRSHQHKCANAIQPEKIE